MFGNNLGDLMHESIRWVPLKSLPFQIPSKGKPRTTLSASSASLFPHHIKRYWDLRADPDKLLVGMK